MNNEEKYFFSDFTLENYKRIIISAKDRYVFSLFNDELKKNNNINNYILWRHDIDHSIHNALEMALIEHKSGVKATYFIHLHNEFYNFFEKDISKIIIQIKELGHEIGLHFDVHYYSISDEKSLIKYLKYEKKILEKFIEGKINVFSFHNTNEFTMNCKKWKYAGLINTYADIFQNKISYCSDSNGYWRFERLSEIIDKRKYDKLQVLTHPELWQAEIMSPRERIKQVADINTKRILKIYDDHLIEYNRPNIDWD